MPCRTARSRSGRRRHTTTSARTSLSPSTPPCRSASTAGSTWRGGCSAAARQVMDEFYKDYGVVGHLMGGTGAQMGGWYRKEIKTRRRSQGAEVPGRRLRRPDPGQARRSGATDSPAATSIRRWRRVPSTPPSGSARTTTKNSGSTKSRRIITTPAGGKAPAWARLTSTRKSWSSLPPSYQKAIETTANEVTLWMLAKYDNGNPAALRRLVAGGVKLLPFPTAVLEACFNATNEVCNEIVGQESQVQEESGTSGSPIAPNRCCGRASPKAASTASWPACTASARSDRPLVKSHRDPASAGSLFCRKAAFQTQSCMPVLRR